MVIPIALFLVALGARFVTGALFLDPAYPDSFYHVNVARELAAGNGFQIDFIWNFVETGGVLPAAAVLPVPSNAHWMPLASLVQVPLIWLLGPTSLASALPFWLASAAVAPVTYWIGRDASMPSWQAAAAGLMVAVPALVDPYLAQPDNFGLFMLLGTLSLWACARGIRGDRRAFALGGVLVGLAFLSRNDGVLLGVPFALAFLADLVRRPRASRIGWTAASLCAGGFLLIASPWIARQLDVFGSISPSAASGRILWITEYRDLYSVSTPATPASFLDQGLLPLLTSRLLGLVNALGLFATHVLLIFLVPFLLLGAWWHRRDLVWRPWLAYAATLFLSAGLVFAVHVPMGTFLHSAVALIPYAYLVSLLGIGGAVAAMARRRPDWDVERASRVVSAMAVGAVLLLGIGATVRTVGGWQHARDVTVAIAAPLRDAPPTDRLMSPDAGAFRYHAGRPGIVTPEDPLPVVEEALRRYDVRWLILERQFSTVALAPVLDGEIRPEWLSVPIAVVDDTTQPGRPAAALYAVCLSAADDRCRS